MELLRPVGKTVNLIMFLGVAYLVYTNFYTALTVLPMYTLELGGTEFDAGVHSILFYAAAVGMRFYFGPLTDTRGRRLPLLIGAFAFGFAPLFFYLSSGMWSLIGARIFQAVGLAAFFSSGSSLVADLAPTVKRGAYIGIYRMVNTLALLTGPFTAMAVINGYGYGVWFLAAFVLGAVGFVMMIFIKTVPQGAMEVAALTEGSKETLMGEGFGLAEGEKAGGYSAAAVLVKGAAEEEGKCKVSAGANAIGAGVGGKRKHYGFKEIVLDASLRPAFLSLALASIGYAVILTFGSIYIEKVTDIDNPGIYFTFFGLAGVVANLTAGYFSDIYGRASVMTPVLIMLGLGTAGLFFLPQYAFVFGLSSVLAGFGFGGVISTCIAWLVDLARDEARGTVLAVQENVIDCSFGTGTFIFGLAAAGIGMGASFGITGAIIVVAAAYLFIRSR